MRYIVAEQDSDFDRIFKETVLIAEFATDSDEKLYEQRDSSLIELIWEVCNRVIDPNERGGIHIIEDWWPDHTRHLDCNLSALSERLENKLQSLLRGTYQSWRIQIVVYRDMMVGATQVGSLVLYSDRALIDRGLYDKLNFVGRSI